MPLSPAQKTIVNNNKRFRAVCAGRRFGKTHLAIRTMAEWAREPNKEVWYLAPTYRQAKMIAWKKLKKKLVDLRWVDKINESELTITLKNASTISLKGADAYDSLRGAGLDGLILDEAAVMDPEAWYEVLRPMLSDKQGKALFITTPAGMNWFYEIYQNHLEDPENWASFSYTTIDGGNVPESEIEQAKKDLDERTFRQEYLATFETYSGRIYYSFDRALNVKEPIILNDEVIYIGMDFNIDPMSAVIAVRQGDDLYVIDEIRMYSSNTQEVVGEIRTRFPKSKIWVFPDPAGHQRKTSASGATDITLLSNAGWVVKAPRSHTPVRDRINAVNSRLCGTNGVRRLFISPRCKYTIEGLERHVYKEGTSQPDKDSGYDHMMDALGYMVDYLFPVKRDLDPELMQPQRLGHRLA
jgi:hypothetical protein